MLESGYVMKKINPETYSIWLEVIKEERFVTNTHKINNNEK